MTPEEREELKLRAKAAGCSVQTYIIRMVLDRPDAQDLPPGPHRVRRTKEELSMTG